MLENVRQALSSLQANKMRALLTMLGIIIGIASVIAIITLGDSLTNYISNSMQGLGANNIMVNLQLKTSQNALSTSTQGITDADKITDEMIASLLDVFSEEIETVSLSAGVGNGKTTQGRLYANFTLTGVSEGYALANNLTILEGRWLNERDMEGLKKVVVVSNKLVNNMFGGEGALGQQITLQVGGHVGIYTVVGVYEYEDTFSMGTASEKDIRTGIYIPISTAQKITGASRYQSFTIVTKTGTKPAEIAVQVTAFFDRYYSRNTKFQISAISMESMMDTVTDMLSTVSIAIATVAAISLLVGGIGVMNIMLVSITERTKEIGTRKALGATNNEIRVQFIVEAAIICLIGGIIGILIGIAGGMFGAGLLGSPVAVSASTIALAAGFSTCVGIFFGYYPANKAAQLDPIDALRYE